MDLTLTITTIASKEEEQKWEDPIIGLVMSKDAQVADAEFLEIRLSAFTAGNTGKNVSETNFTSGSAMPDITNNQSATVINFDGSGRVGSQLFW